MSFEDKSAIYNSLVALVKAGYPFDDALQERAVRLLWILEPQWNTPVAAKLVTELVPSSAKPPSGFVESILTLLSSLHSRVVAAAVSFLSETALKASHAIRCPLMKSDVVTKVLATVQPHTLPISGNERMLNKLIKIIILSLQLAIPYYVGKLNITTALETHNHREMIFQKVVLPSSQFVTFLISNRYVLNGDLLDSYMELLRTLIQIGTYHDPTLEFVLASPIAMAFSSCVSIVEGDYDLWMTLININGSLAIWKNEGSEVAQFGQRMMEALFSEGFEDTLEQMMKYDKSGDYGIRLVEASHSISKLLGSNVPKW
ncbi:hypothetical protein BLNAU_5034 [Blattamonas nauphoetae]|uniref:Uncharacterized protein n=1 Tax=Blattamonas nauphoetae TaxID=2049346 RepID=A0ABQ9Y8S1_9EUKA|nr:hypothetical protein BLNAU_5034 [Blattamonas nauphoetae]